MGGHLKYERKKSQPSVGWEDYPSSLKKKIKSFPDKKSAEEICYQKMCPTKYNKRSDIKGQ